MLWITMLNLSTFVIRERVAFLKLTNAYDVLDPSTGQAVGFAHEAPPWWAKALRLMVARALLPTKVVVSASEDPDATGFFSFRKSGFLSVRVRVEDPNGRVLGSVFRPAFSWRTKLSIRDAGDRELAVLTGDWKGWNFHAEDAQGQPVGVVTKKWAGIGKELFTSADNYVVQAEGTWATDRDRKILLLSAALSIDIILKSKN